MTVSALCQDCAICCQGVLFRYALLGDEEAARLEARGVGTTRRRDGRRALRLGCSALRGTQCSVYEARPSACRAYFCRLAFGLRDGATPWEEAVRILERARAALAEVAAGLPPRSDDDPPSVIERAHQYGLRDGPGPLRRAEAFLKEYFLGPGEP